MNSFPALAQAPVQPQVRRMPAGEFDMIYLPGGDPDPDAPSWADGNCYGARCSQISVPAEGLGTDAGVPSGSMSPQAGTGSTGSPTGASNGVADQVSAAAQQELGSLLASSRAVRQNVMSSFPPPSSRPVIAIEKVMIAYQQKLVFPPSFVDQNAEQIAQLRVAFTNNGPRPRSVAFEVPPVPSEGESKREVYSLFGPRETGTSYRHNVLRRAEGEFVANYNAGFRDLERLVTSHIKHLNTAIDRRFSTSVDDLEVAAYNQERFVEDSERLNRSYVRGDVEAKYTPNYDQDVTRAIPVHRRWQSYAVTDPDIAREMQKERSIQEKPATDEFAETFSLITTTVPTSHQGAVAKLLAAYLAVQANSEWSRNAKDRARAEEGRKQALVVLDIASGFTPFVSEARDIYEAYTGEDLFTGEQLTDGERSLRILFVASVGFGSYVPDSLVKSLAESIKQFAGRRVRATEEFAAAVANAGDGWREIAADLRETSTAHLVVDNPSALKRIYVRRVSVQEMDRIGMAWVGSGAMKHPTKELYISRDGLRQYRLPALKENENVVRANLEKRLKPRGDWMSNGHFDIE